MRTIVNRTQSARSIRVLIPKMARSTTRKRAKFAGKLAPPNTKSAYRDIEALRQPLTQRTRDDVGRSAGGEADDNPHRPGRIALRTSEVRHSRQRGDACGQMQKISAGKFHAAPVYYAHGPAIKVRRSKRLAARNAQAVFSSAPERSRMPHLLRAPQGPLLVRLHRRRCTATRHLARYHHH